MNQITKIPANVLKMIFIVFTFFALPLFSNAQIHSSIDLVGGYDFVNSINSNFGIYDTGKNRAGTRFGANFNFRVFEKAMVKTGVRYVRQGYFPIRNILNGDLNYDTIDEFYLEIPLIFRYEFSNKKFSLYIEAGLSPHIFVKGICTLDRPGQYLEEEFEVEYLKGRRFRLTTSYAIGFQVKFSKYYQLFVQPTLRYFKPMEYDTFFRFSAVNAGVEIGVRRALSFVNVIDRY